VSDPQDILRNVTFNAQTIAASVHGEVDLHNAPTLRGAIFRELEGKDVRQVTLDLAEVPYMDSSAIAVLVETLQKVRKAGGSVTLFRPAKRVRDILQIARLDTIFKIADQPA
jgi:anti-sigma B factor antagonist